MGNDLPEFVGKHILVVEDDYMLAEQLRSRLLSQGAIIVGPVASVTRALATIESDHVDAAILDVNLDAETSLSVALVLNDREIPFVFVTSVAPEDVPERYCRFVLDKAASMQAIGQGLFGLRPH